MGLVLEAIQPFPAIGHREAALHAGDPPGGQEPALPSPTEEFLLGLEEAHLDPSQSIKDFVCGVCGVSLPCRCCSLCGGTGAGAGNDNKCPGCGGYGEA